MKVPIFGSLFEKREDDASAARLAAFEAWMDTSFGFRMASAGVKVDEESVVQLVAAFACIRLLSETLGSLPFIVYERKAAGGRDRVRNHPLYPLLHDLPNPEMTAMDFRSCMMVNCLIWGNAYAEKVVDGAGDLVGLYPIVSPRVEMKRATSGQLEYLVSLPDGKKTTLPADRIFKISFLSPNGLSGYRPLMLMQEAFGSAIATNQFSAKFFKNGAAASGTVEYPDSLSETAYERFKKDFEEKYGGIGNAHRLIFLEEGMKFTRLSTPPNEAQMLETRKFHVEEAARFFNVPPHMIQDLSRATFSNIEHQSISFAQYSIRPWAVRWEQAVYRDLFSPAERQNYFAEILLEGLMRGDQQSRYQAYAIGRQWGWLSADDVRELENMNTLPDGQGSIYLVPMNMVPADQIEDLGKVGSSKEDQASVGEDDSDRSAGEPRAADPVPAKKRQVAAMRARVVNGHSRAYLDVGARIVKRETADIRKAVKKYLTERSSTEFSLWLEEYYRSAPDWIVRMVDPVNKSFAGTIQELVAAEEGKELTEKMRSDLVTFTDDFSAAFAARHVGSSSGQIRKIINEADSVESAAELISERLDSWDEKSAEQVARNEPAQLCNAVARETFAGFGVSRLMWVNTGSETCPYCSQLNGRVVGISAPFILPGDSIDAADGSGLRVYGPKMHPPIHKGCACQVVSS